MAAHKSAQNPYQWPDGTWHSIPRDQYELQKPGNAQTQAVFGNWHPGMTLPEARALAAPFSPPPPVTPPPVDPALENARLGASWNITTADSEAKYQGGETAWGTGYNADGSLNTSNPYSQAMLLQDTYKRSVTGANNSMFAAGQGYSGARSNAQAHNDRTYAEGSSALRDSTRQAYHGIDYGRLQTYGSNSLGVSNEGYAALHRSVYGS